MASVCVSALSHQLKYENGQNSFEFNILLILWHSICQLLTNESDANTYEKFLKQIHLLSLETNDIDLFHLWDSFWNAVSTKMVNIAAKFVEEILFNIIDQKKFNQVALLPVIIV